MKNISKEKVAEYSMYCDALERSAFNSGNNDSSIGVQKSQYRTNKGVTLKGFQ